jgi:2-oxo-4-hydroxy-4-carboxy-5-ureidoimidazoline decarboxylase
VEGNRAYEERFGHVFLICATGLSAAEMLAALRERLGNDVEAERAAVRAELAKIVDLRLARLAGGPEEER